MDAGDICDPSSDNDTTRHTGTVHYGTVTDTAGQHGTGRTGRTGAEEGGTGRDAAIRDRTEHDEIILGRKGQCGTDLGRDGNNHNGTGRDTTGRNGTGRKTGHDGAGRTEQTNTERDQTGWNGARRGGAGHKTRTETTARYGTIPDGTGRDGTGRNDDDTTAIDDTNTIRRFMADLRYMISLPRGIPTERWATVIM